MREFRSSFSLASNLNLELNKAVTNVESASAPLANGAPATESQLEAILDEARKKLYESITLRRTDICISLINEWFKENKNSAENVKYFFNSNYCVNGTTNPLLVAYSMKDRDLIRALLNFGADPGLADTKTNKCLTQLIYEEDPQADGSNNKSMRQLLSDCFMQAIVQNDERGLRQFIDSGFDVNIKSEDVVLPDGNSYLHWAVLYANEAIVRYLLDSGSDVNCVNKYGATPLHECIAKRSIKDDKLKIIETLLVYKADTTTIKGTGGVFKDLTAYELAQMRHQNNLGSEAYLYIKEFLNETASVPTTPMQPLSPLKKTTSVDSYQSSATPSIPQQHTLQSLNESQQDPTPEEPLLSQHSLSHPNNLDTISQASNSSINENNNSTVSAASVTSLQKAPSEFEHFQNWCQSSVQTDLPSSDQPQEKEVPLSSLLWPQPQSCIVISEKHDDRYVLSKSPTHHVYIQPPNTYKLMDYVNRLSSAFSGMTFVCTHKIPDTPSYISVSIDPSLFSHENEYSILVTKTKVTLNAADVTGLQYGLFTFIQLCKIYSNKNIPSLRINDYPDVKNRSVLIDFSQGFYLKYEYLMSLLQMIAFYKINQVHFYVKFSSLPPASTKKQWYELIQNWSSLMKFCEEVKLEIVPAIDITNDVGELIEVLTPIKEYLDYFKGFRYLNIGPRLSSLLTCMENKNPFSLDSSQHMMLCSYLFHTTDEEILTEIDKIDRFVLMEYGLRSGYDFQAKAEKLYKSGRPFFYCVGSANWNSLLGCPDGCLTNIFDAVKRQPVDLPIGMLLCNFSGSLTRTPFAFNLNSIAMFAGSTWNTKLTAEKVRADFPKAIKLHGLLHDRDGEIGLVMLELGHIETYLTRKMLNSTDFNDLPFDEGSIFTRLLNNPDELDLDYLDKNIFKKVIFNLRAQHSKLKSLPVDVNNMLFKEVLLTTDIAINLFKFLMVFYNTGTRQHQTLSKPVGLNVINIGVANLNKTVRTDLANKLLLTKEEYEQFLPSTYYKESTANILSSYYSKLIDKLLVGYSDLNEFLQMQNEANNSNGKARSASVSLSQSNYFIKDEK